MTPDPLTLDPLTQRIPDKDALNQDTATQDTIAQDTLAARALLNCLVREFPAEQVSADGAYATVRLPATGVVLRATVLRPSAGLGPRLTGQAAWRPDEELAGEQSPADQSPGARQHPDRPHPDRQWRPAGWQSLARLIADELTAATGVANPEFAGQVRDSHAAMTAIINARGTVGQRAAAGETEPRITRFLASEQALVAGHRHHPAPKARHGSPRDWLPYAPEALARFPLRFLGVRADLVAEEGDLSALARLGAPVPPPGYAVLPAHPWQLELLERSPWLRQARRGGLVTDLGEGGRSVVPTSSVRTVYDASADVFCKFSLATRITNCVRTSSWYELAGSVRLSELLSPVTDDLADRYPGAALLAEPGYRTVAAADKTAYEGLAVIVRAGLRPVLRPGVTPLVAASLTEPGVSWPSASLSPARLHSWWEAYVRLLVPPVLGLLVTDGVALEPHLQNVIVGVDEDGMPAQVIFRDLEGTKLVTGSRAGLLATLPPGIARGLGYETERAWDRVLYCLLVNHLAEIAAAIADRCPGRPEHAEADLWDTLRDVLAKCAADLGSPPRLTAVVAGAPLPAKANLRVRWARGADREAGYVPVPPPWAQTPGRHA